MSLKMTGINKKAIITGVTFVLAIVLILAVFAYDKDGDKQKANSTVTKTGQNKVVDSGSKQEKDTEGESTEPEDGITEFPASEPTSNTDKNVGISPNPGDSSADSEETPMPTSKPAPVPSPTSAPALTPEPTKSPGSKPTSSPNPGNEPEPDVPPSRYYSPAYIAQIKKEIDEFVEKFIGLKGSPEQKVGRMEAMLAEGFKFEKRHNNFITPKTTLDKDGYLKWQKTIFEAYDGEESYYFISTSKYYNIYSSDKAYVEFKLQIDEPIDKYLRYEAHKMSLVKEKGKWLVKSYEISVSEYNELTAPTAKAGDDKVALTNYKVTLDGSNSSFSSWFPHFKWEIVSKPKNSRAVISASDSLTASITPDVPGNYVVRLCVFTGNAGATDTVVIRAVDKEKGINRLNYNVIDAEYSKKLDKIIIVSGNPNRLNIYDPEKNKTVSSVQLSKTPTSVSVSPDGLYAAVGLDGLMISYVNLQTGTVEKEWNTKCNVYDIVLAGNGYIYYTSDSEDDYPRFYGLEIESGAEAIGTGTVYEDSVIRLQPGGTYIYSACPFISDGYITKFDISGGTANKMYERRCERQFNQSYYFWLSEDGSRIYTSEGNVYKSTEKSQTDIQLLNRLKHFGIDKGYFDYITDSPRSGRIAGISNNDVGMLFIYDYVKMTFQEHTELPLFVEGNKGYYSHGRYAFYNSDGTKLYVIVQADSGDDMRNQYGVVVIK